MRTLLLVGASVFALGIGQAAAQTAPLIDVDDTGNNNSSNITQTAGGTASTVTVIQSQDGIGPGAVVAPDAGSAVGGLNVFVQQISASAASTVRVEQIDNGALGGANAASVIQDVLTASTADILQDGTVNGAEINQTGQNQTADIDQIGSSNGAIIRQANLNNEANIRQDGNLNSASALQEMLGDNLANITQFGDGNMATATQDGFMNEATIIQGDALADPADLANGNIVTVNQTGNESETTVVQLGDTNTGTVNQHADEGIINMAQGGNRNMAMITQNDTAAAGATINVTQNGDDGTTTVVQN
jgi:hypothetical protein